MWWTWVLVLSFCGWMEIIFSTLHIIKKEMELELKLYSIAVHNNDVRRHTFREKEWASRQQQLKEDDEKLSDLNIIAIIYFLSFLMYLCDTLVCSYECIYNLPRCLTQTWLYLCTLNVTAANNEMWYYDLLHIRNIIIFLCL
jgi:hypothetical protein